VRAAVGGVGWEHDDWFGALKTGLVSRRGSRIDPAWRMRPWHGVGTASRSGGNAIRIPGAPGSSESVERLRKQIVPLFERLSDAVMAAKGRPTGAQTGRRAPDCGSSSTAGRKLERCGVPRPAKRREISISNLKFQIHEAAWEQMTEWLGQPGGWPSPPKALPLNDWFADPRCRPWQSHCGGDSSRLGPGARRGDRSPPRNPGPSGRVRLGVNDGVFPPRRPASRSVEPHRPAKRWPRANALVGPDFRQQIGLERYYGYVVARAPGGGWS